MFSKTILFWLSICVFISSIVYAGTIDNIFAVSPDKNTKCHTPRIHGCNSSIYPILDYEVSGWFFNPPFKSCRPLYSADGVHACTVNQDLPLTKQECEDLCAETCTMSNGSLGICMMEDYCKLTGDKSSVPPRPCRAYNVKCCPRGTNSTQ